MSEGENQILSMFKGGLETFQAAMTGTRYAILAKAKGLALCFTPKIEHAPGLIAIMIRVRVQRQEDWANLSEAADVFGFPELVEKSPDHSSCEATVFVSRSIFSPIQVGRIVDENKLVEKLVLEIIQRAASKGITIDIEPAVEYIKNVLLDHLPTEEPKNLVPEDFIVTFGAENTVKYYQTLADKYLKKPEAPAAEAKPDEGDDKAAA